MEEARYHSKQSLGNCQSKTSCPYFHQDRSPRWWDWCAWTLQKKSALCQSPWKSHSRSLGVLLPATARLVVYAMSYPSLPGELHEKNLNRSCFLLSRSLLSSPLTLCKTQRSLGSTGVLSWISHRALNSLNGSGTHRDTLERSCEVPRDFSIGFGTDFNGARHRS